MARVFVSLFLTGLFFGYGPCLLGCGPLLVSYIAATKEDSASGLKVYVIFSLTRLLVYGLLGVLVGFLGELALHQFFNSPAMKILFLAFGLFLCFLGTLLIIEKFSMAKKCPGLIQRYLGSRDFKNIILFGLVVSLSPCLPLIAMLGYIALISDYWLKGVLYMTAFGLGTVMSPMIILALLAGWFGKVLKNHNTMFRALKVICGVLLYFLGANLIVAAWRY